MLEQQGQQKTTRKGGSGPFAMRYAFLKWHPEMTNDATILLMHYEDLANLQEDGYCNQSTDTIHEQTRLAKNRIKPSRDILDKLNFISVDHRGYRGIIVTVNTDVLEAGNREWAEKDRKERAERGETNAPSYSDVVQENVEHKVEIERLKALLGAGDIGVSPIRDTGGESVSPIRDTKPDAVSLDRKSVSLDRKSVSPTGDLIRVVELESLNKSNCGKSVGHTVSSPWDKDQIPKKKKASSPYDASPIEEQKEELPALINYMNAKLGNRAKVSSSGTAKAMKAWDAMCVNQFSYTNQGGQIQKLDAPADLWDKDPLWREWATSVIDYATRHKSNGAESRNAMVNYLKTGDRSAKGEKFTWVTFLGLKHRVDPSVRQANPHQDIHLDTSSLW